MWTMVGHSSPIGNSHIVHNNSPIRQVLWAGPERRYIRT